MDEHNDERLLELDALYAAAAPGGSLEDRIAADFRTPMATRSARTRTIRRIATAAAAILIFIAGYLTALGNTAETPSDGRSFMLLLWQDAGFSQGGAPEQLAAEYSAWARNMAATGVAITGSELARDRTIVPPRPARPLASAAQGAIIGGYFIVGAPDSAAARRLAEGHPHRAHGGWIEVVELVDAGAPRAGS